MESILVLLIGDVSPFVLDRSVDVVGVLGYFRFWPVVVFVVGMGLRGRGTEGPVDVSFMDLPRPVDWIESDGVRLCGFVVRGAMFGGGRRTEPQRDDGISDFHFVRKYYHLIMYVGHEPWDLGLISRKSILAHKLEVLNIYVPKVSFLVVTSVGF